MREGAPVGRSSQWKNKEASLCSGALTNSLESLVWSENGLNRSQVVLLTQEELRNDAETIAFAVKSLRKLKRIEIRKADGENFVIPFLTVLGTGDPFLNLEVFELPALFLNDHHQALATAIGSAITNMPALRDFQVYPCTDFDEPNRDYVDILFRSLNNHPSINELHLCGTTHCVPHIVRLILHNTRIKNLSFWSFEAHWCNFCSILKALSRETHHTLEYLNLGNVPIENRFEEKQNQLGSILSNIHGIQVLVLRSDIESFSPVPGSITPSLLQGFKRNTSFTRVTPDWCRKGTNSDRLIDFYTVRNEFNSKSTKTKREMIDVFHEMFVACDDREYGGHYTESALTVALQCHRSRNDWASIHYAPCGSTPQRRPQKKRSIMDGSDHYV